MGQDTVFLQAGFRVQLLKEQSSALCSESEQIQICGPHPDVPN